MMLTAFVLGNAVAGGLLVLGMPLVFGSLLSLRYPASRPCDRNGFVRDPSAQDFEHASEIPDLAPARRSLPRRDKRDAARSTARSEQQREMMTG